MGSGPNTSGQIDGEKMETVIEFIFLGSKTTVDGDCKHEMKGRLLFGRIAISQIFRFLLLSSLRGFLVPLHFLP